MLEEKEKLTEQEVNEVLNAWDFLEFANSYRNTYGSMYNLGYYTPDVVNRQIQNINMNPVETTVDKITKALNSPKDSESLLRNYAASLELQNMYYKRLIRYNSDMPAFNLTFDVINLESTKDASSVAFKRDMKILDEFCSKFDFRQEFSIVIRQILRQGVYYCVVRDMGDRYTLQELPADFCKITGRHAYGLLFDFNMEWFISNYGVDINMYPKIFKKFFRDCFGSTNALYKPATPIDRRNSTFVYWHQTSPEDGFWCWKTSPEVATLVPYFSALFPDIAMQPIIRGLQEDKYFIEASKLLVGIIGKNKDNKSGNGNNQIDMTPDILGKFLGVARQGLAKQIGLVGLPMEDVIPVEFDVKERNMLTEYMGNVSDQSTSSSATLMDSNKLNVHQSKLAAAIDSNFIGSMYSMFSDFVEFFVNSKTKKYKFKIKFNDFNTPDDKTERRELLKTVTGLGLSDYQLLSRVLDISPFELKRRLLLNDAIGVGFVANEQKGEVGRPSKPDSLNENTQNSIARGTNDLK